MPLLPLGRVPDGVWRQMVLKTLGITQRQLAEATDEQESTVSRVIAGTYDARTARGRARRDRVEAKMAELCGCQVSDLFPRTPTP